MNTKKIIVTGCNGQLGRAVNKLFSEDGGYELINTDINADIKLDITDVDKVTSFVKEISPYAVINCAAYTAVDRQESDVDLSYRINAIGPRNLAIASKDSGAKFIHISTDYVFPGDAKTPYVEFDAVGPKSVYGRTKLAGEEFVKQMTDSFFIIRTAWLYGDGHNFVKTMLKLSESHDEVSVVDDQLGTPTSAAELAKCIRTLLPTENYGLFHGTCEGDTNWADFAEKIFELSGKNTKVRHVTSQEYEKMNPSSAKRPAFSILDNYMLRLTTPFTFAVWQEALETYIREDLKI
ncbi:MAG: dTDP-4-dehydrorhamnose reductase [Lachnospiraceae bacterium]|nr:dTDP-4-dehydrorhamnose reductase [Lachnospiraceae bacterium]